MKAHDLAPLGEVWMQVRDIKRLQTLMVIQNVTHRTLARHAGYKSHAYIGKLVRGEVDTLSPEAAVRIAKFFGVGVDDLFLVRTSSDNGRNKPAHRKPAA